MANLGYHVDGLDISEEMLSQIDLAPYKERCSLYVGDIFDLGDRLDQYDAVVSRWLIPHFPSWRKILVSVHKILKPSGIFYFDMPFRGNYKFASERFGFDYKTFPYDDRDKEADKARFYSSYSLDELTSLAEAEKFEVVAAKPLTFFYTNPIFYPPEPSILQAKKFRESIEELIKTEEGRCFFDYFETHITPVLPSELSNAHEIVLRKR